MGRHSLHIEASDVHASHIPWPRSFECTCELLPVDDKKIAFKKHSAF